MASVCQLLGQEYSRGASHACANCLIRCNPTTFSLSLALVANAFGVDAINVEEVGVSSCPENFQYYHWIPRLSLIAMEVAGLVFGVISTIDVCIR